MFLKIHKLFEKLLKSNMDKFENEPFSYSFRSIHQKSFSSIFPDRMIVFNDCVLFISYC